MKKYMIFLLLLVCPIFVKAADLEYHVCKSGCEFTELDAVFGELNGLTGGYDNNVVIKIDDAETYNLSDNNYIYNKYGWVNSQYRSRIDKLSIEGTKSAPKITSSSLHQDFNYSNRSLFIETWGDITVKNVKIETTGSVLFGTKGVLKLDNVEMKSEGFVSYYTAEDNIINNFNLTGYLNLSSGTVKDSTIKGDVSLDYHTAWENVNITGSMETVGTLALKNVTINANNKDYGVYFTYNDCLGDCGYQRYDGTSSMKNVTIKNAKKSAIFYNRSYGNLKKPLTIDSSDLGSNPTSIIMYNLFSWSYNDFFDGYSVKVTNSKVAGAETYMAIHEQWNEEPTSENLPKMKALNMHFDATNTWVKPIYRVNDPSKKNNAKANVVETDHGRIVIERKNHGTLTINVDKETDLNKYFEELGNVLGEVKVADPTIVKVVNGKIIPLKVGSTEVTFTVDNTTYVLGVVVNGTNPDTVDSIVISIALFGISLGVFAVLATIISKKKVLE